jgi:hypothetical protein
MKAWKDFEPLVALNVMGCPPLAIREALREVVEIFCDKTHVWQVELDAFGTVSEKSDYFIPIDPDQRVVTVMTARFKDSPMTGVTVEDMDREMPTWTASGSGATPYMFRVVADDGDQLIRLYPTPSATENGVIKMRVAIKPSASAESIPDFFFDDWRRPISSGAIARLTAVPGKDYTNADLSVFHEKLFQIGMGKAMNRLAAGMTKRGLRVHARRYGS